MSGAVLVAIFVPVWVGVAVALFLSIASASPEAERSGRRARDLARYRHHPDANLLSLTD